MFITEIMLRKKELIILKKLSSSLDPAVEIFSRAACEIENTEIKQCLDEAAQSLVGIRMLLEAQVTLSAKSLERE